MKSVLHFLKERSHYLKNHVCQTPGAIYSSSIGGNHVDVVVKLPFELELTKDQSELLEAELHYAVEGVLQKLFTEKEDK